MTVKNHDQVIDRREIASALLKALDRRHEVLDAIVESKDREAAVAAVRELLDTTEFCADAVLNLRFDRLTVKERDRIRTELEDLDATLQWLPEQRPYSTGAGVRLRPFTESDADTELFRARSTERFDDAGNPWGPERVEDERRSGLKRIDDESAAWFVAECTTGDKPDSVGLVFGELTGNEVDVAIWVAPGSRKQGYGTAALKQARSELAAYFPGTVLIVRTPA
ncbi:GNAT family N-acetyltransferase [Prescottella agglutinans]|uniref:GNAT family N-acetyltransferase n=1 Tax=Prescottella agglutinans TaxID=1644129 RepID=A0A3S3ATG7_9NOCA|nr:GNAT family N-acetyltransferase [Prescottella agglutinans]RVW08045.1 GNAT family N-acetyltransferase [Prescottella agglutinans]